MPLPIAASFITAALFISQAPQQLLALRTSTIGSWLGPQWTTIVAGLILTFVLWVILGVLARKATAMESVNAMSAFHLQNHLDALQAAFEALPKPADTPSGSGDQQQYRAAYKQVEKYRDHITDEISSTDVRWVTARGYLRAWDLMHRAEEAMIVLQPSDEVVREAWHDEMSIEGSGMDSEADALNKLRTAVIQLNPTGVIYLNKAVPATGKANGPVNGSNPGVDAAKIEMEARDALRDVRSTLNEYRGRLWEGLVSQRNQLMATTFITGLFTYFLLVFAIITGAYTISIQAAAAFYLAGALAGLFFRLYNESQGAKAADDFNLSTVRILVTPFVSGLAAVGGILLLATLSFTVTQYNNSSVTAAIADAFNLSHNGLGIVMATVFGYAPNLFINALQTRAQQVTTQLQNSTAQNQGNAAQGTPASRTPAILAALPASLTFPGVVGQPDPPAQQITLTNSGGGTLVWQAALGAKPAGSTWLNAAPATGSLGPSASSTISVAVALNGLTVGSYAGTVTITATDSVTSKPVGAPQVIMIALNVTAPPGLTVSPASLTFNVTSGTVTQPVTIGNSSGEALNWSAALGSGAPPWVTLSPSSGSNLAGGANTSASVIVNAPRGSQTIATSMTVSAVNPATGQATAGSPTTVPITIHVVAPAMQLSTTGLSFTATPGSGNPAPQAIALTNTGGDALTWTVVKPSASWLAVTPITGSSPSSASSQLTFAVDIGGLAPGQYSASVTIAPSAGLPATVDVELTVNPAQLA